MNKQNMFTGKWISGMILIGIGVWFLWPDDTRFRIPGNRDLEVSPDVIRTKIERKAGKTVDGDSPQNPNERAAWWYAYHGGDEGNQTFEALMEAKAHMENMPGSGLTRDAGINEWEWLGPGNIGGRIRSILIHPTIPTTMWIGGVNGGIWKTVNGGISWFPLNDFLPSLAVSSLVMDPNDPDILYAGTGESFAGRGQPGAGIFKSLDGGITWTQLPLTSGSNWRWVNRLAHHPTQSNILYAVTQSRGSTGINRVWRSTNGGNTFNIVWNTTNPCDIKIHPTDGNQIVVGTCSGQVFSSPDGGSTWNNITPPGAPNNRMEVSITGDGSNTYVYALTSVADPDQDNDINQNFVRLWSRLNNQNWILRNSSTVVHSSSESNNQVGYDNAIWVSPTNPNYLVIGGIDLWRSFNSGTSLTKISDWADYHTGSSAHADQHIIVHHPGFNGTTNRIIYVGNDGGIQTASDFQTVSENSGWVNLANNLGITQFYGGAATPDGSIIVGGTQDNSHLRFNGSTQGWYQAFTGDGGYAAIAPPVGPGAIPVIYGENQYLNIRKSINGGNSYSLAISNMEDAGDNCKCTNRAPFIAPFVMDPNDGSTLVAGGISVWRTPNGGAGWTRIRNSIGPDNTTGSFVSAIDIAPSNSFVIWVGYENGHIAKTIDGGLTWFQVDNGPNPVPPRWITDIAIDPNNSNRVFVTLGGNNSNSVYMTSDAGNNWVQRTGSPPNDLPTLQVNTVRFHPANSNWIYIGTPLGVFASEDLGLNWNVTPRYPGAGPDGHEGPVNTEVFELFWQGDHLIASTHGRGMFRTRPRTIIYVDASVPFSGDGSFNLPYKYIHQALADAGNGTVIHIHGGTYDEGPRPLYFLNRSGLIQTSNGPVIIR